MSKKKSKAAKKSKKEEKQSDDGVMSAEALKAHPEQDEDKRKLPHKKIKNKVYLKELERLQIELVKLQEWIKHKGLKVVVIFEGRDAAGKGGVIKRITQFVSPRVMRVVALGTPTEKERTQWYFQRYVAHLPAGRRDGSL